VSENRAKVCWLGGTRYSRPLNPTMAAKWSALTGLEADLFVVGFAAGLRPRHFTQHAHFYLLPQLPTPILRYAEIYFFAPLLLLWLILRQGVTVIIAQSPYEGAAGALTKQIAGLLGKRVALAVESHGNFEITIFRQRRVTFTGLYRWLMERTARYAFRHADVLRAVSDSTREQLQEWSPDTPIEQFMAWIDADVFQSVEREKTLAEARDLLYVGVLTPLKNVHVLIDAFAAVVGEVGSGKLFLIGKPENAEYVAQLHAQVERLGLQDRIIFVGLLSAQELAGYMARARGLALVSSSEGLPRSIMEAMLCGLPVIASYVGGVPEIVADGETGYLVPAGDVTALAEALRKLYHNAELDTMGELARTNAQVFFSTVAYVDGYRRLIAAALTPSSPTLIPQGESRKTPAG
jgi:glycosyltransferase involved in cell wall biosynthesis